MKSTAVLSTLVVFAYACVIFPTRFDAQGNAWVRLPEGDPRTSIMPCTRIYDPAREPLFDPANSFGVYVVAGSYLIIVEKIAHADTDIDYFLMPKTEEEASDLTKFNRHTSHFYLATGGLRMDTNTLHGNRSRLLTPIDRSLEIVADQAGSIGIPNVHGASCYLNAAIQLLYIIPTLRHRLAHAVAQFKLKPPTLSYQLNAIFFVLEQGHQPTPIMMHNVILSLAARHLGVINGNNVEQFDSSEAIKYLVEDIEAEIQGHLPHGGRWYFRDLLYTMHDRLDHDQNGMLALEESIDSPGLDLYKVDSNVLKDGTEITIANLIKDTYADANHGQGHTHSHRLHDLPTYMFVKFPRFGDSGRVANNISMPLLLNMDARVYANKQAAKYYDYELIGVGLHSGGNYNGGHYTAMVLGNDRVWRTMDDSVVSLSGAAAPQGTNYSSGKSTCALYRRVLRLPEQFTGQPLPARPDLDLNILLASKAAPPPMNGYKTPGSGRVSTSTRNSGVYRPIGGGGGGGSKTKSPTPVLTPPPTPTVTPPRNSASSTALSISTFLLGSAAVVAGLLI